MPPDAICELLCELLIANLTRQLQIGLLIRATISVSLGSECSFRNYRGNLEQYLLPAS
jgi:hypothetical protein